ncbi:hypothetical protein BT96DRAFT_948133, partial [Gymnopus androsaceus JB14]
YEDPFNRLNKLEDMEKWTGATMSYPVGAPQFTEHRNPKQTWYARESTLDNAGTRDLLAFTAKVYERLVRIEHTVFQANNKTHGACSMRVFVRLDVGIIWDDRDGDNRNHRYRYILNEVQPGQCGIFMLGPDAKGGIVNGLLEGLERGSMDY